LSLLSHYTRLPGLEGIASSGTLWATNFLSVEDETELFYGWLIVQRAAFEYVRARFPADLCPEFVELSDDELMSLFREELNVTQGYGHLFMTSFVRHENEVDERRGSLTHWRHFTQSEGYCLQYDATDIQRMIDHESWRSTYSLIQLQKVSYGVDRNSHDFKELVVQLGEMQLLLLLRDWRDSRIKVDHARHLAPSAVARKLMLFCASHKDPAFRDEREVRILAFPENQTVVRPLYGMSTAKKIELKGDKRIIALGANWTPAISPKRIIIGPSATQDIETPLSKFPKRPELIRSDIRLRPLPV
jgi:hypothetical protein